jgi:hypothetical protein
MTRRPSTKSYEGGGEARSEGQELIKAREKVRAKGKQSKGQSTKGKGKGAKTRARANKRTGAKSLGGEGKEGRTRVKEGKGEARGEKARGKGEREREKANARQHLSNTIRSGLLYVIYILFVTNKSFFEEKTSTTNGRKNKKNARPKRITTNTNLQKNGKKNNNQFKNCSKHKIIRQKSFSVIKSLGNSRIEW